MRVFCIDSKPRISDYPGTPMVKEGESYHVTRTCRGHGKDGSIAMCYKLEEFSQIYCFDVGRFIPLSANTRLEIKKTSTELVDI